MKSFAFWMILMAFLLPSIAEPDSVTTGAYNVTFDLGMPKEAYKVVVAAPKTSELFSGDLSTTYNIELVNKTGITRRALITITSFKTEQVIPTPDELMQTGIYAHSQAGGFYDIKAEELKIDGYDSAVISGAMRTIDRQETYSAIYYPSPTMSVGIFSLYPWEEGTLQLIKTIHIEKNATG